MADTDNPSTVEVTEEKEPQAPSQVRTEKEKAEFSLRKNAERVKELGGDPTQILGIKAPSQESHDEEVPAWYKKEKANEVKKTALELADAIEDEAERTEVKNLLNTRIIPSGKADEDFRLALGMVKAPKNKQIVEELQRYTPPRVTAAGGSRPATVEEEFVPTSEEAAMMKAFGLSKEKVIDARKREAEKRG